MLKLIFRVVRILVYIVLIVVPSMEYMWSVYDEVALAVIMTVTGIVGLFLEIYYVGNKKDAE